MRTMGLLLSCVLLGAPMAWGITVNHVKAAPKLDGRLDDAVWRQVDRAELVRRSRKLAGRFRSEIADLAEEHDAHLPDAFDP